MHRYTYIGELFQQEPTRWGLRGDRYLWLEMGDYFAQVLIPSDIKQLHEKLEAAFLTLTGEPISSIQYIFVERLAHGGMSGGCIFPEFWREHALPLLEKRAYES